MKKGNLRRAWQDVRSNRFASDSRESREEVKAFDKEAENGIERIYRALLHKRFRFQPVRGVTLPRTGKKPRAIIVAPVPDRIVLRSLLLVLQDQASVTKTLSNPYSFGGVPNKGVRDAIEAACRAVKSGAKYYLKSDISNFFPSIRREDALDKLRLGLPDSTIDTFLDEATRVELENLSKLTMADQKLFPSENLGVGQGCCLSPLLGNVLLKDFDLGMNSFGVACFRYVDDFLILGPDFHTVWEAFELAQTELADLGMKTYHPDDGSGKASHGPTSKGFEYLGCVVSPGFVQPSRQSRQKLLEKIAKLFDRSSAYFRGISGGLEPAFDASLVGTLSQVHQLVYAWGHQYSFCNCEALFRALDKKIDKLIARYIRAYDTFKHGGNPQAVRRLLGAHLLADSKSDPILPLSKK